MDAIIDTVIRDIVREEIAAAMSGPASLPDPVLIKPKEAAALCGVGEPKIYEIISDSDTNGFPVVRFGPRHYMIDKDRLKRWLATGGLGVKV